MNSRASDLAPSPGLATLAKLDLRGNDISDIGRFEAAGRKRRQLTTEYRDVDSAMA